jgi:hypothetical protein
MRALAEAVDALSRGFGELERDMATEPMDVEDVLELAARRVEQAREDLDRHIAEHGCWRARRFDSAQGAQALILRDCWLIIVRITTAMPTSIRPRPTIVVKAYRHIAIHHRNGR